MNLSRAIGRLTLELSAAFTILPPLSGINVGKQIEKLFRNIYSFLEKAPDCINLYSRISQTFELGGQP